MVNRELIRLKVVQLIYAYYQNEGKTEDVAVQELMFSLSKSHELYKYLLTLLVSMREYAERKDESVRSRGARLGTPVTQTTPDGQFAHNAFLTSLSANKEIAEYREKEKKEWPEEVPFIKKLYDKFIESDIYNLYLTKEDFSFAADREVIRKLYKTYITQNEDFDSLLEDHSLYWNDDKEVVDSFVLKTIKRFTEESDEDFPLLPEFASEEDRVFAETLFRATIENAEELRELIQKNCKNWDFSRMALMDVIIAQIALAEIINFPTIPLNVSINEYLDIAKVYSTPRSASYLNGLLDYIAKKLKTENKIFK